MWTDTPTIFQVVIKLPHVAINLESHPRWNSSIENSRGLLGGKIVSVLSTKNCTGEVGNYS